EGPSSTIRWSRSSASAQPRVPAAEEAAPARPSAPRRQRPFDGPWLAEDDEQVGACRAVGLGPALLPVLQRAEVEAVPRGEGGLRETTPAADRSDLVGTE